MDGRLDCVEEESVAVAILNNYFTYARAHLFFVDWTTDEPATSGRPANPMATTNWTRTGWHAVTELVVDSVAFFQRFMVESGSAV